MSDIGSGEAATVETAPNPSPEAGVSSQPDRNWDAEAREMGWVPKDEFKGDPEKWRPADEFVRRGEEILPIVRQQNRKLQDQLEAQKKDFADRIARMERVQEEGIKRARAEAEAELRQIRAQQREATAAGDTETFDRLDARREQLAAEITRPAQQQPGNEQEAHDAKVRAFADANPWYRDNFEMAKFADDFSLWNANRNPNLSFEQNMQETLAAVAKRFPDAFSRGGASGAANGHAAVDGGGAFTGGHSPKDIWAGIPAEARSQFKKDVARGLFKETDAAKWIELYRS